MGRPGRTGQQRRLERSRIYRHRHRSGQVAAHHRDQPLLRDLRDPGRDTRHEGVRWRSDRVHCQRRGVRPDPAGRLRRVEGGHGCTGTYRRARTRPSRHQIQRRVSGPGHSRRSRSDRRLQPVGCGRRRRLQPEADRLHAEGHAVAKAHHRRGHRTRRGVVLVTARGTPSPADPPSAAVTRCPETLGLGQVFAPRLQLCSESSSNPLRSYSFEVASAP